MLKNLVQAPFATEKDFLQSTQYASLSEVLLLAIQAENLSSFCHSLSNDVCRFGILQLQFNAHNNIILIQNYKYNGNLYGEHSKQQRYYVNAFMLVNLG